MSGQTSLACSPHGGIGIGDFDYYHITHSHADHIGGLEELLLSSHYVLKKTPRLILTKSYKEILWEQSLRGGCEHRENGTFQFEDLADFIIPSQIAESPREIYEVEVEGIRLVIFAPCTSRPRATAPARNSGPPAC